MSYHVTYDNSLVPPTSVAYACSTCNAVPIVVDKLYASSQIMGTENDDTPHRPGCPILSSSLVHYSKFLFFKKPMLRDESITYTFAATCKACSFFWFTSVRWPTMRRLDDQTDILEFYCTSQNEGCAFYVRVPMPRGSDCVVVGENAATSTI